MKQQTGKTDIRLLFVLFQSILYVSFLVLDFTGKDNILSSFIKFVIIILCFCYALFSKGVDKSISFCLKTALLFTVISDLLILILDYYFYGVLTFIIVQQLYSFRLSLKKDQTVYAQCNLKKDQMEDAPQVKTYITNYVFWLAVQVLITIMICYALFRLGMELEGLLIVSVFYFICILTNTVRADIAAFGKPKGKGKRDKGDLLFALGMSLFLLCDINVGLFNLSRFIDMPHSLYNVIYSLSSILMWTFYAPAQVLISLSLKRTPS